MKVTHWELSLARLLRNPRTGLAVAAIAAAYWLITLFVLCGTYFGGPATIALEDGYFAIYWAETPEDHNDRVVNGFTWPYFARGAGTTADGLLSGSASRWLSYGADDLLSSSHLANLAEYPQNLGFYLPGASLTATPRYIGIPAWTVILLGLMQSAAFGLPRRAQRGRCVQCDYPRAGLPPGCVCPECGTVQSPSARAPRSPR